MTSKPQPLNDEQMKVIRGLNAQHPSTWTRGAWYPAEMAGKPVEICRTRSAGRPYLRIRRRIKVHLKTPTGEILRTSQEWEYFTVNLQDGTMTAQGW